jgi:ribose/xylose/arabinose/galactoside ABC-type transport system permease subunit
VLRLKVLVYQTIFMIQAEQLVLELTDFGADSYLVGNGEDAVHEGFPKDGDFDFNLFFGHNF